MLRCHVELPAKAPQVRLPFRMESQTEQVRGSFNQFACLQKFQLDSAWYPLTGGMQDYNYVWFGCYEVTLEISCCKFPPAHELKKYWTDNQLSLVKFLAEAHRGVQGFVSDHSGAPIEKASLKIKGRDVGFQTTKYGEFWRILLPGVYKLEVCWLYLLFQPGVSKEVFKNVFLCTFANHNF